MSGRSRAKRRVHLVHWDRAVAGQRAARLAAAGYWVDSGPLDANAIRRMGERPPDAVLIDLSRAPARGRDVALYLRMRKPTRHLPLVFLEGDPRMVARIRKHLPDAVYATWRGVRGALRRALAHPPRDPVVPPTTMGGYAGTPLPKKLGIKPGSIVALTGAPKGFAKTLGRLPAGVTLRRGARGRCDLALWFVKSRRDLESRVVRMGAHAGPGGLWIIWPKRTSGVASDLTQNLVREIGLANGLVDYKVCAVDQTWSGLRFTRRKR